MATKAPSDIADLLKIDFKGGTLVEYAMGSWFDKWFSRGIVETQRFDGTNFSVTTNRRAKLSADSRKMKVYQEEGVFYIKVRDLGCYAIAPEGIEIPAKPFYRAKPNG